MDIENSGPFLAAAFFCDKVLEEKDGTLSAIHIVNRITHTISAPDAPETMPSIIINAFAVLSFKSGKARGKYTLKLLPTSPSGKKCQNSRGLYFLRGKTTE
ncbi:MAG: hypothetical protein JRI50_00595 [Deltaproteobacteria bacterium]|nr:hypothetical protein [Deltaproteobacteria bacterium]